VFFFVRKENVIWKNPKIGYNTHIIQFLLTLIYLHYLQTHLPFPLPFNLLYRQPHAPYALQNCHLASKTCVLSCQSYIHLSSPLPIMHPQVRLIHYHTFFHILISLLHMLAFWQPSLNMMSQNSIHRPLQMFIGEQQCSKN